MSAVAPNPIDDRDLVKESDVGRIPIDWDAKPLSALASMKSGESITSTSIDEHSPFPCYGGNGLRGYTFRYTHEGNHALIGRQGALCGNVLGVSGRFFASEHAIVATARSGVDIRWLTFVLQRMKLNRYSESSAQPGLSVSKLQNLLVAVPQSQAEQEAIAAALSDADALIEGLESFITKKRAIKQGAMQELLFGHRRLAGFGGEWETSRFGAIAAVRNDKINTFGADVAAFCVELEQIDPGTGQLLGYSDARSRATIKYRFQRGDVLFGRLRPYLRKFWFADRNGVCSTEIWPLLAKGTILVADFLAQIVKTDAFVEAASSSYGTHMPRSDWKALADHEVALPKDLDEQRAIAAILSDMDSEIESLTSRLIKARQIKQGMMQELLTGRIRLI